MTPSASEVPAEHTAGEFDRDADIEETLANMLRKYVFMGRITMADLRLAIGYGIDASPSVKPYSERITHDPR